MSLNNNILASHIEKIGWIILYPSLEQEVYNHTAHIIDAHLHIQLYHMLHYAQTQYADMIRSIHKTSTPQSKKDEACHKAEVAKQECFKAAQYLMETNLNSLLMIEALVRSYHGKVLTHPRLFLQNDPKIKKQPNRLLQQAHLLLHPLLTSSCQQSHCLARGTKRVQCSSPLCPLREITSLKDLCHGDLPERSLMVPSFSFMKTISPSTIVAMSFTTSSSLPC